MKNYRALILSLLAAALLALSATAAEYGVVYTEAECLASEELTALGEETLPRFTETYGIDLRVDVLRNMGNFTSLEELAPAIYDAYDYGAGEGRRGVTLTVVAHEDADGAALEGWYVYAGGDSPALTAGGPQSVLPALSGILTEENWAGDAVSDSETLARAVAAMAEGLEDFVLSGGMEGEPEAETSAAPDTFPPTGYVTDTAGILTAEERQLLEEEARAVSEQYGFGVYIITMEDFTDVTDSSDVFDGATALYTKYDLGLGEERRGVLLLLSMAERDYSLVTYSDYGNFVFDQTTREGMSGYFLDDFAQDDWFAGFVDYLSDSEGILMEAPDRLRSEINGRVGMIFLFPLIIAVAVILVLGRKMKSVAKATRAEAYAVDGLQLTQSYDRFTHATEVRRKRKSESSGGGGGGSRSRSSGGFGGTSGKF